MYKILILMLFILFGMNTMSEEIKEGIGDLYREACNTNNYVKKLKILKKMENLYPEVEEVKLEIAKLYLENSDINTAMNVYETGIKLKENSNIVFEYGNYYYGIKNYEKAYNIYLQDNTRSYKNYIGAAMAARQLNKIEDAKKYYTKAIKKNKMISRAYIQLGKIYYEEKNIEESIKYFKKYNELEKTEDSYILLGNVYILSKNDKQAKELLNEGIKRFPKNQNISKMLIKIEKDRMK